MTHAAPPGGLLEDKLPAASVNPLVPTVFHEPWWLDIVTNRRWVAAEVMEDGRVTGRLPYHVVRGFSGPAIGMPPLTHFLGPAIDDGPGSHQARWLKRGTITRGLIDALPRGTSFWQKFHRGVTDVVPFQAARFDTAVQFTFEIEPAPEALLWSALRDKHRNVIRKAGKAFAVETLRDSEEFARFYARNLEERGRESWAPRRMMAALTEATLLRDAGRMFAVRDRSRNLAAAIFCPHDHQASYYTLSTRRPDSGNGAVPLLIWEAIRRAARDGLVFDFDGLSAENAIGLYAGFGGVTSPRYVSIKPAGSRVIRAVRRGLGLKTNPFGS